MTEQLLKLVLAFVAGTAFLSVAYSNWREARMRKQRRAGFLDLVQQLFDGGLKAIKPDGFPRISGSYRNHTFDIQVVTDSLNLRKLPAMWLLVTLPEAMPVGGTFDMMMRPRGIEPFSKFAGLPIQLEQEQHFPHDCAIRTDAPLALPPSNLIARHLGLFNDPRAKELVISPQGLRVVWLAEEAHRGRYLIFRDGEMARQPLDPKEVRPLFDYLLKLRDDIVASGGKTAA